MEPPTLQNEAPDPPFWIAFDVNFGYMLMICSLLFLLIFGIDFGVDFTVHSAESAPQRKTY